VTTLISRGRIERLAGGGSADTREVPAVLSTVGVKADGHNVMDWEFPRTVPLIDSHLDRAGIDSVIGKVIPRKSDGRLLGTLCFAAPSVNERAGVAYELVKAGFVSDVSVGFQVLKATRATGYDRPPGSLDIQLAQLQEVSVVAIGADSDAKIQLGRALSRQSRGRETRQDRELIARALAEHNRDDISGREARERRARELARAPQAQRTTEELRQRAAQLQGAVRASDAAANDALRSGLGGSRSTQSVLGIVKDSRQDAVAHHAALGAELRDASTALTRASGKLDATHGASEDLEEARNCVRRARDAHKMLADDLATPPADVSAPNL
jgi:Caudovirus prohead serine protease